MIIVIAKQLVGGVWTKVTLCEALTFRVRATSVPKSSCVVSLGPDWSNESSCKGVNNCSGVCSLFTGVRQVQPFLQCVFCFSSLSQGA